MEITSELKIKRHIDLPSKTVINLMFSSRYVEEQIASELKDHELSIPQYNVLRILRGHNGRPASLGCIQERMVDKNSNTTRLVDKLINKGLTSRRTCPDNRRKVEIELTDSGLNLLSKLDPITLGINEQLTRNLTKNEQVQLNTLLDKLRG
jgi:DNA-binding MarR family transcriptional regulator